MNITGIVVVRLMCRARPNPEPSGSFTSTIARSHAPARRRSLASAIDCTHCTTQFIPLETLRQRPAQRRIVFDEEDASHQSASGKVSVTWNP